MGYERKAHHNYGQAAHSFSQSRGLSDRTPPDRDLVRSSAYDAKLPRWSREDGQRKDAQRYDERNPSKRSGYEEESHHRDRKEKRGRDSPRHKGQSPNRKRSPAAQKKSPAAEQSPDMHHRRKRKLQLSSEEDEEDDVPLTKSIKAANKRSPTTIPLTDLPTLVTNTPITEEETGAHAAESRNAKSPIKPVPIEIVDDVPTTIMSPPNEEFPPVPDEIPMLMEGGDLEHVLGPTILPGVDVWKPVTLNHDGHPKQVNLPFGFGGRELSDKECSLLLLAWEDMGVFQQGKYEGDSTEEDAVYCQYRPVFEVLPQTVSLADNFRCGPLHGLAARTAIGFLFVDATRRVSLLSSAQDSASFQQCDEDLKILHEAGYDMGVVRRAFKYNVKLHIQLCNHEIGQLPAAIQTADEKQAKEIREMELRERKAALETQMAALTIELQQIEQKLEEEAAGFDIFPGLSKAELEELLVQRQKEKEALEPMMQD